MQSGKRVSPFVPLLIVALIPILSAVLSYTAAGKGRTGADEQARQALQHVHSCRPWFEPFWSPPSPTAEALLFVGQAAAGAAVLSYAVMRLRARRKP